MVAMLVNKGNNGFNASSKTNADFAPISNIVNRVLKALESVKVRPISRKDSVTLSILFPKDP